MATQLVFPEKLNGALGNVESGDLEIPTITRIRSFQPTAAVGNPRNINDEDVIHEIFLPVPIALSNNYGVQFDTLGLGAIGQILSGVLNTFNGGDIGSAGGGLFSAAAQAANAVGLLDPLKREGGFSLNKYNELSINAPNMRTFNLSFDLAPSSEKESNVATKIIRALKIGMHPTSENSFLNTETEGEDTLRVGQGGAGGDGLGSFRPVFRNPLKYIVDFVFRGQGHEEGYARLFRTAPCFISNLNVNYHRAGAPAYLPNGSPAMQSIDLTLQEIFPLTRDALIEIEDLDQPNSVDLPAIADPDQIGGEFIESVGGAIQNISDSLGGAFDFITPDTPDNFVER